MSTTPQKKPFSKWILCYLAGSFFLLLLLGEAAFYAFKNKHFLIPPPPGIINTLALGLEQEKDETWYYLSLFVTAPNILILYILELKSKSHGTPWSPLTLGILALMAIALWAGYQLLWSLWTEEYNGLDQSCVGHRFVTGVWETSRARHYKLQNPGQSWSDRIDDFPDRIDALCDPLSVTIARLLLGVAYLLCGLAFAILCWGLGESTMVVILNKLGLSVPDHQASSGDAVEPALVDKTGENPLPAPHTAAEASVSATVRPEAEARIGPSGHLDKDSYTHVIALVHGIKDIGAWKDTVSDALAANGVHVAQIRFGMYPATRFLFPLNLSKRSVDRVLTELRNIDRQFRNAKISVIAHSFGTYVMQEALRKDHNLKLWKLVFCGSVADDRTDWAEFQYRIGDGKRPTKDFVLNDCGTGDAWPVLGTAFGWHYGMAGATGFSEVHVTNRFHRGKNNSPGGHSLYFDKDFVSQNWRPFLIDDQTPRPGNGKQGQDLPRYIRVFYYPLAQWCARITALLVWLALAGTLLALVWFGGSRLWNHLRAEQSFPGAGIRSPEGTELSLDMPLPTQLLPNPIVDAKYPTPAQIREADQRKLEQVLFTYCNNSTQDCRLLFFDCAMSLRPQGANKDIVQSCFVYEWPFPGTQHHSKGSCDNFTMTRPGASWLGIYYCNLHTEEVELIGFFDLTTHKSWKLSLQQSNSKLEAELTHD